MSNMKRIYSFSVIVMLVALNFLGCTPQEEIVELQVGKDITSLKVGDGETPGQSETIEVQALTDKGKNAPFTIETEGDCVSVSSAKDSITVVAGTELCEQTITVKSGSAKEKTITVIVYDPMAMDIGDGLLIRYTNKYQSRSPLSIFDIPFGSLGSPILWDTPAIFWHPDTDVQNGWYPLGSLILQSGEDVEFFPMIVVKDSSKEADLLAKPNDYEEVWYDTKNSENSSIWKAVCPDGFVAFGVVASSEHVKPSSDDVRCVKKKFTTPASRGTKMLDDKGSKSGWDLSIWSIDYLAYTKSPDGRAALLTGTNLGCRDIPNDVPQCDESLANLLLVPLPVYSHSENTTQPKLTKPEPLDTTIPRFFSSVRVPFTLIPNEYEDANPARIKLNIEKSPFYYVQREEKYTSRDIINNTQGSKDAVYNLEISTGYVKEEQETFSHEFGVKVTAGGGCSFLGSGGKWEVELSYQFGWEKSVSETYSKVETRDFTFTVPARTYAQIVQVTSQFRAIPDSDELRPTGVPFNMNSNIIMYLQYPYDPSGNKLLSGK